MLKRKAASVGFALKGIKIAFKEETNFQIQLFLGLVAILFGWHYHISTAEWLFVIGACGLVLTAELFNTALEELCDMLRATHDPHVAKIKDLAAGAVLVASFTALLIGLIIFVPKIFNL
jgi:undecaprenol kinase/diacylglycerol kinase (ATP)